MIEINGKKLCESCLSEIESEPCRFCGFEKANARAEIGVLAAGSVLLGKYIVGKVIGKGGFGITYLAYDIKNEKKVAIKEYYPSALAARGGDGCTVVITNSEEAAVFKNGIEKFYEEASLVSRFNGNPAIVSVYEFFYENDTAYFVMELLDGCTLKSYIAGRGVLSPEETLFIADNVSGALVIAHSINVLHRDISPDNIMICRDGNVKLIDFGAARQVLADNQKSMSVILKRGFAPLEQYQRRGKQGAWTDIYSFGATLYYALAQDCIDDPMTRMDDDKDFLSNKYDIEEQLWEIIARCLQLRIDDRYQDAFELRNALKKISYAPKPIVLIEEEKQEESACATTGSAEVTDNRDIQTDRSAANKTIGTVPEKAEVPKNKNKAKIIGIASAAAAVAVGGIITVAAMLSSRDGEIAAAGVTAGYYENVLISSSNSETTAVKETTERKTSKSTEKTTDPEIKTEESTSKMTAPQTEPKTAATTAAVTTAKTTAVKTTDAGTDTKATTATAAERVTTKATTAAAEDVIIAGKSYSADTVYLDLTGLGLNNSDIKNLKKLKKLTTVMLNDNNISNLSVFSELSDLEGLWINNNRITDLSPLKNLKNLKWLSIDDNQVSDLSPLSSTRSLEQFWCGGNPISDLSPISKNKGMHMIGFRECRIKDLSALSDMPELEFIAANDNNISSLSPLGGTRKLEQLYIDRNPITDLSPISKNKGMVQLGVAGCQIGTLSALSGMTKLETLYAFGCGLTDIEPLKNCTKLKTIDLAYNYLDDVSPLFNCDEISVLALTGNQCSDKSDYLLSFNGITLEEDGTIYLEEQNFSWDNDSEVTEWLNETLNVSGSGRYYYAA